jgi:pyruvate kinase
LLTNKDVIQGLKEGESILFDDGTLAMKYCTISTLVTYLFRVAKRISNTAVECEVVVGGVLKQQKGINIPQATVKLDDLLEKDKKDALFLLEIQVDFVGLSFVQVCVYVY